ncbi:MAG: hypothetical protein SFW67_07785 [Myxococcaceae bacterium]|nr:hypothetical protein [Myxococcaceae bacterium]
MSPARVEGEDAGGPVVVAGADAGASEGRGGWRPPAHAGVLERGVCDAGACAGPVSRCLELEVRCEAMPPAPVQRIVTEPSAGTPRRRAILLGEGGNRTEFTALGRAQDGTLQLRS